MAVYPNGRYALSNPGRYFGAAPGLDLYARARGDRLNVYTAPTWDEIIGGSPTGYGLTGVVPPIRSGAMSARVATHIAVTATGSMLMGLPVAAEASFAVAVADVTGELISSGGGSATITIDTIPPLLTAAANSGGTGSFSVSTNAPILGAEASLTGTAGMACTGSLVPYAIGVMAGSTQDTTGMTPAGVAQAVWTAVAAEFDGTGTMGQKINAAGTAGDPWAADLSAYAAGTAGYALDNVVGMDVEIHPGITLQTALQALLAVAAGKATGGGTGEITFRDVADTRDIVSMTVDANGNRTAASVS